VLADAGSSIAGWKVVGPGGVVTGDPMHPGSYIADSPSGLYANSARDTLTLRAPLDLSAGVRAYASFEGRWAFETDYDGAAVEASFDSLTWYPLAGLRTLAGTSTGGTAQTPGAPGYRGTRWLPGGERVDLSAFTGPGATRVRLRVRLRSDGGTNFDGLDFDSLKVVLYDPAAQPAPAAVGAVAPGAKLELSAPEPNPARGPLRMSFTLPRAGDARLEVLDVAGRRVRTLAAGARPAGRWAAGWDLGDEAGRPAAAGMYFIRLAAAASHLTRRIVVLR